MPAPRTVYDAVLQAARDVTKLGCALDAEMLGTALLGSVYAVAADDRAAAVRDFVGRFLTATEPDTPATATIREVNPREVWITHGREDALRRLAEHASIAKAGGEVVGVGYGAPDSLSAAAVPNARSTACTPCSLARVMASSPGESRAWARMERAAEAPSVMYTSWGR